jgi:DNA polymerase III alpha subunit (gram-positive type)
MVPLPLDLSTYVVFDFETSGFDPETESIIQFAAVRVEGGRVVEGVQSLRPTYQAPTLEPSAEAESG